MANKNVLIYPKFGAPKEAGVYHRLLCLTGQKKGEAYYLVGDRLVIGRGDKCEIQVFDLKSSREHAELKKMGENYIVSDLGSQNGILINDLKVSQYTLKEGDRLVIGQTVFKYGQHRVSSNEKALVGQSEEGTRSIKDLKKEKAEEEVDGQKKKKKKNLLIIAALGMGALFLLDEEGPTTPKTEVKEDKERAKTNDLSDEFSLFLRKKMQKEDKELEEKLNVIFQRGLREAREGNYFRAINEFNLALILSPQNARATYYLKKTTQSLDSEVEKQFLMARKDIESARYKKAIISYCAIVRLLQNFPEDQRYKDALANIQEMEKTLGIEEGETKCTEE